MMDYLTVFTVGFDVNSVLKGGWTALMYACEYGNQAIIQLLLERGANPNSHKGKCIPQHESYKTLANLYS